MRSSSCSSSLKVATAGLERWSTAAIAAGGCIDDVWAPVWIGIAAALLLADKEGGEESAIAQVTFYLLLGPVFYPILQKAYDGIIVNIIVNCYRKKFDCAATTAMLLNLLVSIPKMMAQLAGAKVSTSSGTGAKMGARTKVLVTEARKMSVNRLQTRKSLKTVRAQEEAKKKEDAKKESTTNDSMLVPPIGVNPDVPSESRTLNRQNSMVGGDDGDGGDGGDGGD